MKIIEQIIELVTGHSDVLTKARKSLDDALEDNRKATDRLRELVENHRPHEEGEERKKKDDAEQRDRSP